MQLLLELSPYVSLIVSVIGFIVTILLWMARKEFATNSAVGAAMARANDAHHRIDLLTKDVQALPTHSQVHQLREAVSELTASLRELRTEVKSVDDKVDDQAIVSRRIEQHLLNQAG